MTLSGTDPISGIGLREEIKFIYDLHHYNLETVPSAVTGRLRPTTEAFTKEAVTHNACQDGSCGPVSLPRSLGPPPRICSHDSEAHQARSGRDVPPSEYVALGGQASVS